ncbi:MAG: DUF6443 domain-containing protein, partial [Cytophagales bacterium]|nr:DUF6443 domain-containing protein [Cytophagales bacterium]
MKAFFRHMLSLIFGMMLVSSTLQAQTVPTPSDDQNYIIEHTPREANITNKSQLSNKNSSQVSRSIQYFDGLGRPMQQIGFQASPNGNDFVQHIEYDAYGREQNKYLPFQANTQTGAYLSTASSEVISDYNSLKSDSYPYSRTIFEPSPLNRILKQGAPGSVWQPDENYATSDRAVVFEYTTNTGSEVFMWEVKDDHCILSTAHYYTANELYVTITKDENWDSGNNNTVREYKDKLGRVVLKRTYESGDAHDTYYVYDDFGNLRFVIPPEAINQMGPALAAVDADNIITKTADGTITSSTGSYYYCPGVTVTLPATNTYSPTFEVKPFPVDAEIIEEYLFVYKYDGRNRMIEKKVPGAEPVYMIYDDRDRLVLTQDGEQRKNNLWLFTKYDALNRPVLTGAYTNTSKIGQSAMQGFVDGEIGGNSAWYETRSTAGGNVHGYDNASFPEISTENSYLTVTYYDSYTGFDSSLDYPASPPSDYSDNTKLSGPKGQVTGGKVRNINTNAWYENAVYYDDKYRPIYTVSENHKSGLEKTYNLYNFVGDVVKSRYVHTAPNALTIDKEFDYDHMSRLNWIKYTIGGTTKTILTNEYNEIGELVTKYLHGSSASNAQQVDYEYNIRGWLTDINDPGTLGSDYFGMRLKYNNPSDPTDLQSAAQYNGNISEIHWKNAKTNTLSAYGFVYDDLNRLTDAHYGEGTSYAINSGDWDEDISYDYNGNISDLDRYADGTHVDDLSYNYTGNRLNYVNDGITSYTGEENHFKDGTSGTSTDYTYDDNGNMISDANKGISSITYNHLNLPTYIDFGGGNTITYIYDAAGMKLQKVVTETGKADKTTDYIGGLIYEDDVQKFISTEEGRIMLEESTPEYQYHMKDHLGSVRLTFTTATEAERTSTYLATMETVAATLEEATFENLPDTRYSNTTFNHTAGGTMSARLNTYDNKVMGPAMTLHVMPDDEINMSVWAKYSQAANSTNPVTGLAAIVAASAGVGAVTELSQVTAGLDDILGAGHAAAFSTNNAIPKAYLNYLFFDKNGQYVNNSGGFVQVGTGSLNSFKELTLSYTPDEEGYMVIYVANQTDENLNVYFDDMTVEHIEGPIVRTDDYYPFGLTFNSSERSGYTTNKFLYNGKELQLDLNLDWYDYGRRFYDPALCRFHAQDRFAEKYLNFSPYQYGANSPIFYIDMNGDSIVSIIRQDNKILIENSPLKEGGENFTNTITFGSGIPDSHVTDKSAGVVNDAMVSAGDNEVKVSSGYRSPEKQVEVMYDNLETKGVSHQKALYGSTGDKVIDVYIATKGKTDKQGYGLNNDASSVKSAMTSKINELGPGKVSKHSSNPKVYNVFDIAPSSVSNVKSFQSTLQKDKRVSRV